VLMNWARAGAALEASRAGVAYAEKHELHQMAPYSILTERWLQLRAGRWAEAEQTALANAKTKVTVHRLLAETVLAELAVRRGDDDADERLGALSTRAKETGELQRLVPVSSCRSSGRSSPASSRPSSTCSATSPAVARRTPRTCCASARGRLWRASRWS
jgi:hypothetical protein